MKIVLTRIMFIVLSFLCLNALAQTSEERLRLLVRAADAGDAQSQNELGSMYENGTGGVSKNFVKAAVLYLRSAEQGNVFAQANLATLYLSGLGVDKNIPEAFAWLKKAAGQGLKPAQYLYSWHCELDKPEMKVDLNNAINWYIRVANAGDVNTSIQDMHNCPSF